MPGHKPGFFVSKTYRGSEWQNDYVDLPDYYQTFFRNYDQTLGRWIGIDPQAESAESMTPYQYAGNNPVMSNDPIGDLYNIQREAMMQAAAERNASNGGLPMSEGY